MIRDGIVPENEPERLAALRRYAILGTPPDGAFDGITAVTAAFFRAPIAIVSLVDHDRIWFKSHHGIDATETDRAPGLCASAILSTEVYQIRDITMDPRTLSNSIVAAGLGLRFYAAAPLRTFDGFNLGTLCVIDREPRELTAPEGEMLKKLAAIVMDQMELRLGARRIAELELSQVRLEAQTAYLYEEILNDHNFGAVIAESPAVQRVMRQARLVSSTDASVLIRGETGTGKELIARAIHDQSARKGHPLIKVNCGAVPDNLFESEFFGHVRGAFTGAIKDRLGRFELADGGTLFLDEIGEVPLPMQAKLLRVLQEQEMERVGDQRTRKVDVRIIAATNRDLNSEVDAGRFREDLFYRLNVFPIELPPLRERREDIPPLAAHFTKKIAQQMNRPAPPITGATMSQLIAYDWPGNVRQLQNAIERGVILAQGGPLLLDLPKRKQVDAPNVVHQTLPKRALKTREQMKSEERDNIVRALKQTGGKIFGPNGAAELLGMKPTTLASRIRTLRISREAWGSSSE